MEDSADGNFVHKGNVVVVTKSTSTSGREHSGHDWVSNGVSLTWHAILENFFLALIRRSKANQCRQAADTTP